MELGTQSSDRRNRERENANRNAVSGPGPKSGISEQFDDGRHAYRAYLRDLGKNTVKDASLQGLVERHPERVNRRPLVSQPDVASFLPNN
jgi:hypothetical protein